MLTSRRGRPLDGERVLDLFAGSGALGLECLSRGAAQATFVERDRRALACLRTNLAALGVGAARGRVMGRTVAAALAELARLGGRFDLVFMDPPYAGPPLAPLLAKLVAGALVAPEGLVVCEHAPLGRRRRRRPPSSCSSGAPGERWA